MLHRVGIGVQREYLAPLAQQMHQISPVPASSVENAQIGGNVPAQNLIEYVDINLPKLLLNT
jgi:hypothetical protein